MEYSLQAAYTGVSYPGKGKCQQTKRGISDRAANYGKGVPGPSQTLQSEKEAMVTSGGRHSVGQGTSPVQSGRRLQISSLQ